MILTTISIVHRYQQAIHIKDRPQKSLSLNEAKGILVNIAETPLDSLEAASCQKTHRWGSIGVD